MLHQLTRPHVGQSFLKKMMYVRLARRIHARQRLRSQATKLGNGYDNAYRMQLAIYINLYENMLQPDKQHDNPAAIIMIYI